MAQTNEQAVAGTRFGLIELNDTVTWKAKHLMKIRIMKVKITAMDRPHAFTDEMLEGDFKSMKHEHHFKQINNGTFLIDLLSFEIPYGRFGKMASQLFLNRYMKNLLEYRNRMIKDYAESEKWKFILEK